eukprot:tig00020616_g12286.t1
MPAASETIERSCPSRRVASRGLRAPPMRPRPAPICRSPPQLLPAARLFRAREMRPHGHSSLICGLSSACSSGRPRICAARGLVPASHRLVQLRPPAPRAARGLLPPIHHGAAGDVGARRAATRQLQRPLAWPLATSGRGGRRLGSFGGLSRGRWRRRRAAGGDSAASAASRVACPLQAAGDVGARRAATWQLRRPLAWPLATRASGGRRFGSFGGLSRGRWRRGRLAGGDSAASAASCVAAGDVGARRAATRQLRRPLAWLLATSARGGRRLGSFGGLSRGRWRLGRVAGGDSAASAASRVAAGDVGARRAATRQLRRPLAWCVGARGSRSGAGGVGAARLSLYDGSAGGRAPGARPPPPLTQP